jgi:hypothetical protein
MRQTYSKIFDTNWNIVVNLGIKCNTLSISREAGVRYFSSPFDNMDTVEGLTETADLMSTRFANYFDDIKMWNIKNEIAPRSIKIRNKIIWHKNTSSVYYPHFADSWFEKSLSKDELHRWKTSDELDISPVWSDMKRVFGNRQNRLVAQLESKNKILFFRADEPRQLSRVHSANQNEHIEKFILKMQTAFPQTEIGLLYLYCNNIKYNRQLMSSDYVHTECIPGDINTSDYCIAKLKKLKLCSIEELRKVDFNSTCSKTE